MKQKSIFVLIFLIAIGIGIIIGKVIKTDKKADIINSSAVKYDNTQKSSWDVAFQEVLIKSTMDTAIQRAFFYATTSAVCQPLIVSLHTWSGDYTQKDTISLLSKKKNWNYIHPDFRGNNVRKEACCSDYVISDIDDAIDWAIKNAKVDTSKIYVIGASGGGMATLFTFMRSKHKIRKFSAWVPVTDLAAFYYQGLIRHNKYPAEALCCAGEENNTINAHQAEKRSPIYYKTPIEKLNYSTLEIYTGIYDGIQGSVPISHAVNFYNKILKDLHVSDQQYYVNEGEKSILYNQLKPTDDHDSIGNRLIFLKKKYKNVQLIIFQGNHEMLPEYAMQTLN